MTKKSAVTVIVSVALLGSAAEAAIVELVCQDIRYVPLPEDRWSFDHDLQLLTLTDFVYEVGVQPYHIFRERSVRISGRMDSESRFTVVESITNKTGVPLTGYTLLKADTVTTFCTIVEGSVQASGGPEVHKEGPYTIELTWADSILDGESFTIQFDLFTGMNPAGVLSFSLNNVVIPEPTAMTLLGLGALALLRSRRDAGSKQKA